MLNKIVKRVKLQSDFIDLTTVISVDNVLGANEIDYIMSIGGKLGFGREFIRIVIRWAGEGIVWKGR